MSSTQPLFTPTGRVEEAIVDRVKRNIRERTGAFWAFVGSLVGAAALGTVLAVMISWYYPRKATPSKKPPYGTCGGNSYAAYVISASSYDGMPTLSGGGLINIGCSGANAQSENTVVSVPLANDLANEPGVYFAKTKNYLANAPVDLSSIDLESNFIPNNALMAPEQLSYLLDDAIKTKPPMVVIAVWGDASKILSNSGVVQKIQTLGGSDYLSIVKYAPNTPYIFQYLNGGVFVAEYANNEPGSSLTNVGEGSVINPNVNGSTHPIQSPSNSS